MKAEASSRASSVERTLERPLRVLLMCNYDVFNAATVSDHVNAFVRYSIHQIYVLSRVGDLPDDLDLDQFDVVILHYSLFLALDGYVSQQARNRLRGFAGLKAMFIQDEYRWVDATIEAAAYIGVGLLFTCVPEAEIPRVYPAERLPGVRIVNVLTGYVPQWLTLYEPRPLSKRRVDVGYRGRRYPAWHGAAGLEKIDIGRRFKADARRYNLKTDIAWTESSRLYGRAWVGFTQNCRAVLAVESGASVFDFDGRVAARTETVAQLTQPERERARPEAIEALRRRYFADREGLIDLSQLSPRIFEAAALRTLLIAYEGRYSGALEPWRHYLPLKKDHSNMNEVVAALRDDGRVSEIIAEAYAEVAMNPAYSYKRFMQEVDAILAEAQAGKRPATRTGPSPARFHEQRNFFYVDNPHALDVPGNTPTGRLKTAARARLRPLVAPLKRLIRQGG